MVDKRQIWYFYIGSLLFIGADLLFIAIHLTFMAALLPLLVLMFYWALFAIDKLMLLVVFFTPLSIDIFKVPGLGLGQIGVGMALPTEPIMFGIMLFFLLHVIFSGYDKAIMRHPVSILILLSLVWMLVTAITGTMYFVSFKYLIERSWGVITFYFLGILLFKNIKNIFYFNWLYIATLTVVIIYTFIRHYPYHFSEKWAHIAVQPFYNDHTAYGAMLAMFIPVLGGLSLMKRNKPWVRTIAFVLFLIFMVALGFSFCRAAWLSIVVIMVILLLMSLKVRLRWIAATLCVGVFFLFAYQNSIILNLERNRTDVSENLDNEIESISNVSSDASNLERLNRWSCAYRMWQDKPVFGFGPGTYMFQYAPYQLSYMQTIISTNEGNGGNAHSEYLGPLAEEGLPGLLLVIGLVISMFIIGFRLFYNIKDSDMRILVASIFLGLVTYFVHGLMNNFLDTDKAAVPFWGFIGMLVAIDLYSRKPLERGAKI